MPGAEVVYPLVDNDFFEFLNIQGSAGMVKFFADNPGAPVGDGGIAAYSQHIHFVVADIDQ
jgi:hypothetical protein